MFTLKCLTRVAASLVLGAAGTLLPGRVSAEEGAAGGRRLEVLFLGDHGHHQPRLRYKIIARHFGTRGVNFTYTENLNDLNAATLSRYDALLVYANTTRIEPEQEGALLEYVAGGGAFLPIHCASYCFHNSEAYIDLVGAQFQSHGTGVFTTRIVDPDHAVMAGFEGFETWDETYVHHRHNPERTVLQVREEEPWTWVRTHGEGRVFYTAYGHDERCWDQTAFHDLLLRGLIWAVRDTAKKEWEALDLPPLVYHEAQLPNYERRDPPPKAQEPLSPAESMKYAQTPVETELTLFAAEPDIVNPITMAWDERGRMWVLETVDYPNNLQAGNIGNDRLRILEDTDGDGRADRFTLFADKLSIPTSIVFINDGVLITNGGELLFLKDTDGDDRADVREVLFSGWNMGDTHAGPSNLQWGFDNWIWGTVGYSGFRGRVGEENLRFSMGVFRFRPDGTKLEFLQSTTNNTWGLAFTEEGEVVGSTANNNPSWYLTFPRRYYETVAGFDPPATPRADVTRDFYPITPDVRQVDAFGNFTAAAGHHLYTARNFPESYWNRAALICGPTGHLLYRGLVEFDGCVVRTTNGGNIYASADAWSAPVCADVGPDGAIWFCDWYNIIVQHNPTPTRQRGGYDAETGRGAAYVTPLRDKEHGRIYRVAWKEARPWNGRLLSKADPQGLAAALSDDNLFWRRHAQRLLVERGSGDVVPQLLELVAAQSVDGLGLNPGALHALWTLDGLGLARGEDPAVENAVFAALGHPAGAVRRAALKILEGHPGLPERILEGSLLADQDARTVRDALLALSAAEPSEEIGQALYKAQADRVANSEDPVLVDAMTVAAARHAGAFLRAALEASPAGGDSGEAAPEAMRNLFANPGFEEVENGMPKGWTVRTYGGNAEHGTASPGHTGDYALEISSEDGADSSFFFDVEVEPESEYELTAWIRTENVRTRRGGRGAQLNIHALPGQPRTAAIRGTQDWTPVILRFKTGRERSIGVNCLFGGWGLATGRAWWDDVILRRVSASADSGNVVLDRVAAHYRETASPEALEEFGELIEGQKRQLGPVLLAALGLSGTVGAGDDEALKGRIIELRTIPQKLLYDQQELEAKAGELFTVRFENDCDLPHNFALLQPGALEKVGTAADLMAADPAGLEKSYVPDLPEVLHTIRLLNSGERGDVTMQIDKAGDYPYVCTFPGHWRIMQGVLHVRSGE